MSLSATLPVKPSVTTTSAAPVGDLVALDVADEVEAAALGEPVAQRGMRLDDERRALRRLLAVGQQPDARALDAEHDLREAPRP